MGTKKESEESYAVDERMKLDNVGANDAVTATNDMMMDTTALHARAARDAEELDCDISRNS